MQQEVFCPRSSRRWCPELTVFKPTLFEKLFFFSFLNCHMMRFDVIRRTETRCGFPSCLLVYLCACVCARASASRPAAL